MKSTMPLLIGLGGLKTSGKDTVADFLVEEHGFVKVGMSEHLHRCLLVLNPWIRITAADVERLTLREAEALGLSEMHPEGGSEPAMYMPTFHRYADICEAVGYDRMKVIEEVRISQQKVGHDIGRNMISDDIWVNGTGLRIDKLRREGHPVAVTGIRYSNELKMIRRLDGHTIWVDRPELRLALGKHPSLDTHASETSLDHNSFDRVIVNDGTRIDLREKALVMVEQIMNGVTV